MKALRFSLFELLALTAFAALACVLSPRAGTALSVCLMVTVLSYRTAIVDFTAVGCLATLVATAFGVATIMLLVWWSVSW